MRKIEKQVLKKKLIRFARKLKRIPITSKVVIIYLIDTLNEKEKEINNIVFKNIEEYFPFLEKTNRQDLIDKILDLKKINRSISTERGEVLS